MSGSGEFEQRGAGTTIFTAANSYNGGTTIGAGTLQLGNGGATGSIVGNVVDNGTFAIDRSDTFTFGGVISGSGAFEQLGAGTTIFTAANTYTGGTVMTSGILVVGSDANLGAASGTLTFNGGTLENTGAFTAGRSVTINAAGGTFRTDADLEVSGPIGGAGRLTKTGVASLTLTGTDTYLGGTTISAGTLQLGNGGATGSIVGNVVDNGTFAIDRSDIFTFGGAISGSGGFMQIGPGTTLLTGSSIYLGATSVDAGKLVVNGSIVSPATVQNGGALGGTGTVGSLAVMSGGILAPGHLSAR